MPENDKKELSKHKFSYDIQKKQYIEGNEKFNTEMKEDGYIFQFDRLYTIHNQDLKTYKFKAKLTAETLEKEKDENSKIIGISDEQKAPFTWSPLNDEIWHIDTTIKDYNAMVSTLWQNMYDSNGERLSKTEEENANEERGVQYYEAMDIILNDKEHHLPEDWNGKDKIYFITDINPEFNLNVEKIYPQVPEGTNGIIDSAIQTIVQGLETLVSLNADYDDVVAGGLNPEEYGFERSASGKLIKT